MGNVSSSQDYHTKIIDEENKILALADIIRIRRHNEEVVRRENIIMQSQKVCDKIIGLSFQDAHKICLDNDRRMNTGDLYEAIDDPMRIRVKTDCNNKIVWADYG